jgi:hypothetical protein
MNRTFDEYTIFVQNGDDGLNNTVNENDNSHCNHTEHVYDETASTKKSMRTKKKKCKTKDEEIEEEYKQGGIWICSLKNHKTVIGKINEGGGKRMTRK